MFNLPDVYVEQEILTSGAVREKSRRNLTHIKSLPYGAVPAWVVPLKVAVLKSLYAVDPQAQLGSGQTECHMGLAHI